jgi:hypothetical protein
MKTNSRILVLGQITACLSILGVAHSQTVLWSDNFDDGNGNNRWAADAGVWQIGTNSYFSPFYCASTGLTSDYPAGMNTRLFRIQTFTVPAANQYPRLRFEHWYYFSGADYGVVEIRVGTGAWQAVSPNYTGFSGDWTYTSVDLSAFAGQTVDVAFHALYVNGGGNNERGWYVDDISVITGTPALNNPEGFEAGIGDWYVEQGTWQVGSPPKSGGAPTNSLGAHAYAGTKCAVTLANYDYPAGMNSRFISPPFILPPASTSPYLRFWHWYNFSGADYGVVEIKVGTNAWQAVSSHYTSSSGNWTEPFVDLTSFGGQTVQLAFHALYVNGGGGNAPGWYVDNVQVYPNTISSSTPYINVVQSRTNAILNWTYLPEYTGFTLESTTNFPVSPTNWNTVSTAPVVVSGQFTVTNPITGTQKYFQLVQ